MQASARSKDSYKYSEARAQDLHEKLRSLPFMQDTVNSFSQRATSIKRRAHRIDGDAISFNNTASSSKPLILAKQPQAQSVDRRIQKELEYSKPCKELQTLEIYHFKGG